MAVQVTLEFPAELEARLRQENQNFDADVKEAYALELFRQGRLSHYELSQVLGLDRFDTDALLKRRHIFEGSMTAGDLEADRETLERLMGRPN
jgi:predicted HTH domain antitoxin